MMHKSDPIRPIPAAMPSLITMSQYTCPLHQVLILSLGQRRALIMLMRLRYTIHPTIEAAGRLRFLMCHVNPGIDIARAKKEATTRMIAPGEVEAE